MIKVHGLIKGLQVHLAAFSDIMIEMDIVVMCQMLNFHYARLKHEVYFNFSIYLNHKQMQLHHSQLLQ
jgi:hypothetical protein